MEEWVDYFNGSTMEPFEQSNPYNMSGQEEEKIRRCWLSHILCPIIILDDLLLSLSFFFHGYDPDLELNF